MTRVDLDLSFNYDVRHSQKDERVAQMKDRHVPADEVYVDDSGNGCLFAVETETENVSIDVPADQIPRLMVELAKHAPGGDCK